MEPNNMPRRPLAFLAFLYPARWFLFFTIILAQIPLFLAQNNQGSRTGSPEFIARLKKNDQLGDLASFRRPSKKRNPLERSEKTFQQKGFPKDRSKPKPFQSDFRSKGEEKNKGIPPHLLRIFKRRPELYSLYKLSKGMDKKYPRLLPAEMWTRGIFQLNGWRIPYLFRARITDSERIALLALYRRGHPELAMLTQMHEDLISSKEMETLLRQKIKTKDYALVPEEGFYRSPSERLEAEFLTRTIQIPGKGMKEVSFTIRFGELPLCDSYLIAKRKYFKTYDLELNRLFKRYVRRGQ